MRYLAEHVADDEVAVTRQIFQHLMHALLERLIRLRQDDTEFAQQATHPVNQRRTLGDITLMSAVNELLAAV